MAANKRKQDEKHLKTLREMASLPNNKQCFDCHQRGPTYINMTIGSFVCTSCSGILRGLNPPHRVKSISMASFTPDEMEFLKSQGNDFARKTWLGLFDTNSGPEPDSRDEQKVKDFMIQKYERKRWYVEQTQAMKDEAKNFNESSLSKLSAKNKPAKKILGSQGSTIITSNQKSKAPTVPGPVSATPVGQPATTTPKGGSATMDLLGDLGGDLFASAPASQPPAPTAGLNEFVPPATQVSLEGFTQPEPSASTDIVDAPEKGGGFANFDSFNTQPAAPAAAPVFPAFSPQSSAPAPTQPAASVFPAFGTPIQPMSTGSVPVTNGNVAPASNPPAPTPGGGDRYAALADLDTVFGPGTTATTSSTSASSWSAPPATTSTWASTPASGGAGISWGGGGNTEAANVVWNNGSAGGTGWSGATGTASSTSTGLFSSSTEGFVPSRMGPPGNPFKSSCAANPFGGTPAPSATAPSGGVASNPFAGGGQGTMFGGQPPAPVSSAAGGFGNFGANAPASNNNFGQFSMQNGGFGAQAGSAGAVGGFPPAQGVPGYAGAPGQAAQGFGGAPNQGGWGQMPAAAPAQMVNPFMAAANQQHIAPRSGSTNPFL